MALGSLCKQRHEEPTELALGKFGVIHRTWGRVGGHPGPQVWHFTAAA